ncbi:MAG: amidohydrolase [Pseudomonas sp.]
MKRASRTKTRLALLMLGAIAGNALALDAKSVQGQVSQLLDHDYPHLDALYKDFHQHPELGFQETRSAKILAKEMRALGFEVTEGVGKTGLVAIYRNGPGPTVLVRTELDALPLAEKTGLPYASHATATWKGEQVPVMHACGHDLHMAAWVGTASALVRLKAQWRGTLMFIAQPSEEAIDGARAMLADGLFQRFGKPDYGFALHVGPMPYGQVFYRPGASTSSSDSIELVFHGKGGHGSMPASTIDPILIASRFVDDVQSLISRETDPTKFGVVTIGAFQAGSAGNIIPDQALLRGTVRTFDPEVRQHLLAGIRRIALAEAQMAAAPEPEIRMDFQSTGPVVNDADLAARTVAAWQPVFGKNVVQWSQPASGSEDYSAFIEAGVPSLFFGLGGYDPDMVAKAAQEGRTLPVNHSPLFAPVPEPSIRTGVTAMTLAVMNVMPTQP